MTEVEIFKVSSHHFSQPSLPFHSPFFGVAPPHPSSFAIDLSIPAFQSQFPTKNRVLPEIFSKKDDVGTYRLGSPHGAPILGTVSQGDTEFSQMGGFQIEGLSPSKMAKVCEVLSSLDIKVYSRRKNRIATDI
ncbi:hypothetical protein CK203_064733 [Vitis vinifera]|uniref:Uncharacterized protein n=1 Tax=Vitis vinifera TaxID=29760 RepID=A0A438G3Q3_VITVI|nr:hypothetical protein CK203_064733 [Vitis vinifera]